MINRLLVPVDPDSPGPTRAAVAHAIELCARTPATVYLLSVQPVMSGHVAMFFAEGELAALQEQAGREELAALRSQLEAAGVACELLVRVGRRTETIVREAQALECPIVMAPGDAATDGLFGSVADQVRHLVAGRPDCQLIG